MKLFLIMLLAALTTEVQAQSFLKKLGNEVGKAVKKEIVNQLTGKDNSQNNSQKSNQNNNHRQEINTDALPKFTPEQAAEQERQIRENQERYAKEEAEREAKMSRLKALQAVVDNSENVVRDNTVEYIDEYGINHGGGIMIDSIVWAPVNCGYHATDFPYGKLYQWGRYHGQGYCAPFHHEKDSV